MKTMFGTIDIKIEESVSSIESAASSAIKTVTIKSPNPNSPTSFFPIIRYIIIMKKYKTNVFTMIAIYILSPILLWFYVYFLFNEYNLLGGIL